MLNVQKNEQVFGSSLNPAISSDRAHRPGSERRLDHILETATVLIARDGYTKASMRTVAGAADISLAGLYHYFDSKEKMLFLIQFRSFSSLLRRLQERLHGIEEPTDRLRVAVLAHVMQYAYNKAALRVCAHELDALTGSAYQEVLHLRHQIYRILRTIVDGILDERVPASSLNAHVATMSLFGALNWLYQWYDPREDRSPGGLAQLITDQFLNGLLGAGQPQRPRAEDAHAAPTPDSSAQHNGPPD